MLPKIELDLKFTAEEQKCNLQWLCGFAAADLMKVIFKSKIVHFKCLIRDNLNDTRSLIYCSLVLRMHTLKSARPPLIACCYLTRSFIT